MRARRYHNEEVGIRAEWVSITLKHVGTARGKIHIVL